MALRVLKLWSWLFMSLSIRLAVFHLLGRKNVRGRVGRLRNLFQRTGFRVGPDNALVVGLNGLLQGELARYFQSVGGVQEDMMARVYWRDKRYGIVDGEYTWIVVMELHSERPTHLESFRWPVIRLISINFLSVMGQPARSIKDSQPGNKYIEATPVHKLYGMENEYKFLCGICGSRRPRPGVEMAKAYNGGNANKCHSESAQTIIQLSQTEIQLDVWVIGALGNILT